MFSLFTVILILIYIYSPVVMIDWITCRTLRFVPTLTSFRVVECTLIVECITIIITDMHLPTVYLLFDFYYYYHYRNLD